MHILFFFLIHSVTLCLLTGEFNSLRYKEIFDRHHQCNGHKLGHSRRWWGTWRPGMLLSVGLQRVSEMTGWLNKTCTYCHFVTCFLLIFVVIFLFVLLLVSSPVVWDGEGNGNPLQYSRLENLMDGGAWWTAVHGVMKSWTQLSDFTFAFHFHALEKEMATHSSVLAWRIPGTGEPGVLLSMGRTE